MVAPLVYSDVLLDRVVNEDALSGEGTSIYSIGALSTIINNGSLTSLAGNAIISEGQRSSIFNNGEINALVTGVELTGDFTLFQNSKHVTAELIGVAMLGNYQSASNDDNISSASVGILSEGLYGCISNHRILTGLDYGIKSTGIGVAIINSGGIGADGTANSAGIGILATGQDASIVNIGSIGGLIAIDVHGSDATISNFGNIQSFSETEAALRLADSDGSSVINRGTMSAISGLIIEGGAGDDTIRNRGGLYGRVELGAGNDVFDSRGGSVGHVYGGRGNDVYFVGNELAFHEEAKQGRDTLVYSTAGSLGANFENLLLIGHLSVAGNGNYLSNTITGNSGDNRLTGGGRGDIFVFSDDGGFDTITDFQDRFDRIDFSDVAGVNFFAKIRANMTAVDGDVVIDLSDAAASIILTIENTTLDQMSRGDFIL